MSTLDFFWCSLGSTKITSFSSLSFLWAFSTDGVVCAVFCVVVVGLVVFWVVVVLVYKNIRIYVIKVSKKNKIEAYRGWKSFRCCRSCSCFCDSFYNSGHRRSWRWFRLLTFVKITVSFWKIKGKLSSFNHVVHSSISNHTKYFENFRENKFSAFHLLLW